MTDGHTEILQQAREATSEYRAAARRAIDVGLVAIKVTTRDAYPAATGVVAIDSDQGPFLWITAVVDPTAPGGHRTVAEWDGVFQDHIMQIAEMIEDSEFRRYWLPFTTPVSEGWILEFDAISDDLLEVPRST